MKIKLNNNELFIGKVFSYLHATGWNEIVLSITFWVGESGGVVESTRIFRVRDAYVFVIGNLNKECCDTPLPRLFLLDDVTHLFFSIYLFHSILSFIFFLFIYILPYLFRIFYLLSLNSKIVVQFKRFSFYQRFFSYIYAFLLTFVFVHISILFFKSMYAKQNHLQYCLGDKCKIISAIFCFDLATSCFFFLDIVSWNNQTYISILTINLNYCFSFSLKSK